MKLSIALAFIIFLGLTTHAQSDSALYSFFVAGHTYGSPGIDNEGFHPPFKQKFDYIQSRPEIEFGVLTGDIVSSNPNEEDWDEIDADIDSLGLPVYFAVGNHDMENRPLYESRYGITYYYFSYQNDLFIVLDPNLDEWNISGLQLQFLQDIISENATSADNIYVFFHQILWRESDNQFNYIFFNSIEGRADSINFWSELMPVFQDLSNEVIMFAGDLGASWSSDVTYDHFDNITLIASGMGDEEGENFIVVNVNTDKSLNYDLICLSDTNLNCLGALNDYLVVSELVGIEERFTENSLHPILYPNPTSDYLTISINTSRNTTIQLFNLQAELVLEEHFLYEYEHTIDLRDIPKGIYLLRIVNDLDQSTLRVILE